MRLLDKTQDEHLIREAWGWETSAPRWFRESIAIWKETVEDALKAPNEVNYGLFDGDDFIAMVRLCEEQPWQMNSHLMAKRGASLEQIYEETILLRDHLFANRVTCIYGYVPRQNRSVRKLYKALGFEHTSIKVYKGLIGGRVGEFYHYLINNRCLTA